MVDASTVQSTLVFGALIALVLGVRTYRIVTGAPIVVGRLLAFTAFYILLFALLVGEAYTLLPLYLLAVDAVILGATVVLTLPYVRREIVVAQRADGQWIYRMGPIIPVVYLVLFLVRLGIDVAVLNESFAGPPVLTKLSPTGAAALAVVDALFAFSTGLLTARSVGVYREYEDAIRAAVPRAGGPRSSPPLPP